MTPEQHIKEKLKEYSGTIPYDDFSDLAVAVGHSFNMSLAEASELIHKLRGDLEIGSQEYHHQGFGKNNLWRGQDEALNFGSRPAGDLAEPKSSLVPISKIELAAFKVGDKVRVVKNDQAPWGAEYIGIIERINAQNTFDIRDIATGVLQTAQPLRLLKNPLGEGRPDIRDRQRPGNDALSDIGDPNATREYPGMYHLPLGQHDTVKNPKSLFYKEANIFDWFKKKEQEPIPERPRLNLEVGNKVTITSYKTECHCKASPGERPQVWVHHPSIVGKTGTVLAVFPSSHEKSGFSFNDADILLDDRGVVHYNEMHLSPAESPRVKVEEPTQEKLERLKKQIAEVSKTDPERARQLFEQYQSLTKTADVLHTFLITNIVKEFGESTGEEASRFLRGKIGRPSRLLTKAIFKYNLEATSNSGTYKAKNYKHLFGLPGFSNELINNHIKLYEGYVKNVNDLLDAISDEKPELVRRFGWEFDGMRLHELYFDAMSKSPTPFRNAPRIAALIKENFGSYERWLEEFKAIGNSRGIGWVVTYQDGNKLINCWINEHAEGHLAGATPLIVMDVFEHAYMLDYGTDREKYINVFMNALDWKVIDSRAGSAR